VQCRARFQGQGAEQRAGKGNGSKAARGSRQELWGAMVAGPPSAAYRLRSIAVSRLSLSLCAPGLGRLPSVCVAVLVLPPYKWRKKTKRTCSMARIALSLCVLLHFLHCSSMNPTRGTDGSSLRNATVCLLHFTINKALYIHSIFPQYLQKELDFFMKNKGTCLVTPKFLKNTLCKKRIFRHIKLAIHAWSTKCR
jgi:hypothetical protein